MNNLKSIKLFEKATAKKNIFATKKVQQHKSEQY